MNLWNEFKSLIIVISAAIVALTSIIALYGGKNNSKNSPALKWKNLKKIKRWTLITVATVAIAIGIIVFFGELFLHLKIPAALGGVIKKEGNKIAQQTEKNIMENIREGNEKVVTTLVDSEIACSKVFRDALEQTKDKGYIYFDKGFYITGRGQREENRLLTERQRKIIERKVEECLDKHEKQNQYSLMHCVLSDEEVTRAIKKEEKPYVVHLTPYEKIGIIGGFIGELILEHINLRNQPPKSSP